MSMTATERRAGASSGDLCDMAGITYRMCDNWTRQGFITPSVAATGSGSLRRWSDDDVRHVLLMARLVRVGFTPSASARIARDSLPNTRVGGASTFPLGQGIDIWIDGWA